MRPQQRAAGIPAAILIQPYVTQLKETTQRQSAQTLAEVAV
jgi:hypothetical protein